jgi:hypothetical protein
MVHTSGTEVSTTVKRLIWLSTATKVTVPNMLLVYLFGTLCSFFKCNKPKPTARESGLVVK